MTHKIVLETCLIHRINHRPLTEHIRAVIMENTILVSATVSQFVCLFVCSLFVLYLSVPVNDNGHVGTVFILWDLPNIRMS